MARPRRRGRVGSLLLAVRSIACAYAWMVPVVVALRMDASVAIAILSGTATLFVGLYVVRPLRGYPREAAQLRLRSCRRYLPWLTLATAMKLVLMLSTLALHDHLAARRMLPRLPNDEDFVSTEFLAEPLGPVALFLAIAVLAPLIEEFAFRGHVQHALEHAFGVAPAVVASAVAFSVLHGRIDAIHHLAFGLFAGWVVWRTGSIWAAVYMHALNNAAAQLLMHVPSDAVLTWRARSAGLWPFVIAAGLVGLAGLFVVAARIAAVARVERPGSRSGRANRPPGMAISPVL
jgi:membrane protease YdiL (CAAX protease family)